MEFSGCTQYSKCSAPFCPMDKKRIECIRWYPDEEICVKHKYTGLSWIRMQRKISKKVKHKGMYFILPMLEQDCVVKTGIKGIDPDKKEENQIKVWFKGHPKKRELSKEEREKMAQKLAQALGRTGL